MSADVDDPAILHRTQVSASAGVEFRCLEFRFSTDTVGGTVNLLRTDDASRVVIADNRFVGADNQGFGNGLAIGIGGGSVDVEVVRNEISHFHYGIASGGSQEVRIANNEIWDFSADAVQILGVTDMVIEKNYLHDARKPDGSGVHQDFIQLYSTATSVRTERLAVLGNVLDVGNGKVPQGIFLGNEAADSGGEDAYYRDITVEGNLLYGARYNGILVAETVGATIRQNTLLQVPASSLKPSQSGFEGPAYAPSIRTSATDVSIEDNVAAEIPAGNGEGNVSVSLDDYPIYFEEDSLVGGPPHRWVPADGGAIDGIGAFAWGTPLSGEEL